MIGSNLLEQYKVIFDFRAYTLTLSDDVRPLVRPMNGLYMTFRNHPVNNAPMVKLCIGPRQVESMIDTGQPYALVIPMTDFAQYRELLGSQAIKSKGLMKRWPGTVADFNYLARFDTITMSSAELRNVICLFAEVPKPLSVPYIGVDLLSQYKMTINYPTDQLTMVPYADGTAKDNVFSTGIYPEVSDRGDIVIAGIWIASPGDKAELQVGDVIASYNGETAAPADLTQLRYLLSDDTVTSIVFEIMNPHGKRQVTLQKETLF